MAGRAKGLEIGAVEAAMRGLTDGLDMIDHRGFGSAPNTAGICSQPVGAGLLPFGVISPFVAAWPLGVVLGLPRPVAGGHQQAFLTAEVCLAAMAADARGADWHQGTCKCWRPRMATA